MQRIDFRIYDELGKLINDMVKKYGFASRADFFRYLAIDFIRREGDRIPTDDILKEHTKAMRAIKAGQGSEFL
ncbi:MAG: ribbon-helix-helix domain-containing protein [Candidatus Peregrinibacteria bacterium]|nr:ribbon-helix-helix domain-containing protein [Candidatus Peregrinibacteria bacterium]